MKILLLKPQDICYGLIDKFVQNFGVSLSKYSIEIVYYDFKIQPVDDLLNVLKDNYSAIVDFYSGLLHLKTGNGDYFWNYIDTPIFQICLDFPLYILDKMNPSLQNYYMLCLDQNYCSIVHDCMPNILKAYFFPMAGLEGPYKIPWNERTHEIIFIGTYSDYRPWLSALNQSDKNMHIIGYTFFCNMRDHVDLNQKQAFELTLSQLNLHLSTVEFYKTLEILSGIGMCATSFYRELVIKTLLEDGLKIEVFGNSWKNSPLAKYPNLIILEQLNESEYISVMQNAKISLNLSYCNHNSLSERYSYTMLNGAVCVSDITTYLSMEFSDGHDIIFYQLDQLNNLPKKIRFLLNNPKTCQKIASSAYKKAIQKHTWDERAKRFLEILDELQKQSS